MKTATDPFLSRNTGDGIVINIHWDEPNVARLACVLLKTDTTIDTVDIPVEKALDALNHPAMYSDLYAEVVK